MNRSLAAVISVLNQARTRKVVYCKVRKTKHMVEFLNILRQNNFIYGFGGAASLLDNKISVYFRFHKYRETLHGIRQFSKGGHKRYLIARRLKFLSQKMDPGQIYISNTAAFGGMLNLHRYESLNNLNTKHKCGELIATVW